ncbi:MAG: NAD(P)(+) transhydrogenase (Re/Si-specific) subunit beta [Phycisphaerales bacterium]|nr:MAG: NAD(P)(+) transhydrogenase (Re/Si-specific) subunit beta [Phycisphaerales bacterium]
MSYSHIETIRNLAYLLASVLFIFGLKGLTHPRTAVRGMQMGALGMFVAVLATVMAGGILSWTWVVVGLLIGSIVGALMAIKIPLTDIPQMVALFNGFGGAASFLVAGSELVLRISAGSSGAETGGASQTVAGTGFPISALVAIAASGMIGSLTLFGSMIASGKLHEVSFSWGGKKVWMSNPMLLPGRHAITGVCFAACLVVCALVMLNPGTSAWYWVLIVLAAIFGILITIPIGGADMPVVIALLNSYSGLAACATGFVINNTVLIIAGALVGASGLILTNIMCKAMNRSLAAVMFATMGEVAGDGPSADDVYEGKVKATSAEELAMLFDGARRIVIVPGYGMAVSQAQHAVRDLANLLESRGADVEFAIHPVAGRMPGHMNVLLAEADISYDKLKEMDEINPTLETVDVGLVVGANDVVNPVARTDPSSPIAGMPIIDIDKCRTVVVIKRSLSPGFAGIPNPLFAADNTLMLFSDGKQAFVDLISAVKES